MVRRRNIKNDGAIQTVRTNEDFKAPFVLTDNAGTDTTEYSLSIGKDIGCHVGKDANQSIADATFTIITWNTEDYDTDSMHDNVTNNSRITINTAGKYILHCSFDWTVDFTVNTRFAVRFVKNAAATELIRFDFTNGVSPDSAGVISLLHIDNFIVGDFIQVSVYQDSDGAKSIAGVSGAFRAHFAAQKIDRGG